MGFFINLSCFPKKKVNKIKSKISSAIISSDLDEQSTNIIKESPLISNLVNNCLSNSEINLLQEIRKEKIKRPNGIPFKKYIGNKFVIRIASWNVQSLTLQKLKNTGVMTVICLTILENSISLIALQEVDDEEVASMICKELNTPSLQAIQHHTNSHKWNFIHSQKPTGRMFQRKEYGMIIYDSSQNITILQTNQLNNHKSKKYQNFTRNPFFINIKIGLNVFLIVVFHIKAKSFENNSSRTHQEIIDISVLAKALKETLKPGHKVIFLGDFNEAPNSDSFQPLKDEHFMFCIDDYQATNVSTSTFRCYDNIWINDHCNPYYTGLSGVIKEGLTHSLIPKAEMRGWGGNMSDHRPIWADFFITM